MYLFRRIELDEVVGEMLLGGDGVVSTVVASGFLVKRKKTGNFRFSTYFVREIDGSVRH